MKCPLCGKEAKDYVVRRKIPHFGEIVIVTLVCNCGYKHTDVMELEEKGEKEVCFLVDSEKKLNALVVRSSTGKIVIEEYGLEIQPGPFSEGFITTVEGIIDRFERVLGLFDNREAVEEILSEMKSVKKPFTVRIYDPRGLSTIIYTEE